MKGKNQMNNLFQNNYESENDRKLDKKFSYNYQVIKSMYPKASELPEDEVRGIIRKYYQAPQGQEEQAIKNYISQKEPEWQTKYFDEDDENKENTRGIVDGFNSLKQIYQDYKKYAPMKINDKYKHALLNCRVAQRGPIAEDLITNLSRLKEFSDVYITKSNTAQESFEDTQANTFGRSLGKFNKNGNCEEMVQQRYKRNF